MTTSQLYSKQTISDLVLLTTVDENNILATLKSRYTSNDIYTYIGNVLLSVNPFKTLNIFGDSFINRHRGRYTYELPPHLYAIAEHSVASLRNNHTNQCVIISGESGAGKTEASKLFMQYIAAVSSDVFDIVRVKDQILQSSPVLESFGNASTKRNSNSSRFGKYMEISFNFESDPIGGEISNFLLEKSRVVQTGQGERSFHIFYQITNGTGPKERAKYALEQASFYNYLSQSDCMDVKGISDKDDLQSTIDGLRALNISNDLIDEIFRVISAVLWIGQIAFETIKDKTSIKDEVPINHVAQLLKCDSGKLRKIMLFRSVNAGKQASIATPLDEGKAVFTRDAFAKLVYDRLFQWIVRRINETIKDNDMNRVASIGILDIYGFEIFQNNSFEQLCINYANEKLQQVFISGTLQAEQVEYDTEGIVWTHIDYFDNKIVCDLIEKKPYGVLAFLDESCVVPQGSAGTFMKSLTDNFHLHPHFSCPKQAGLVFAIAHYAGNVTYNCEFFLEKNKDLVWSDLLEMGCCCNISLLKEMFPSDESKSETHKRPITAGTQFRNQVNKLTEKLNDCEPHYIRCIKPNESKKSGLFEDAMVLHQIKYLGLLENVRVRRAGFAYRLEYQKFVHRYKMLSPKTWPVSSLPDQEQTKMILDVMQLVEHNQYEKGRSKIFIREPISLFSLEELRSRKLHEIATIIQKIYRSFIARRYFRELREKAIGLFGSNKLRRVKSFNRNFFGDYIGASSNPSIQSLLAKNTDQRILYLDTASKINRRMKTQNRALLLTESSLLNLSTTKFKFKRRIDLRNIEMLSLSQLSDNFVVIHVQNEYDYVYMCERKSEFVTALAGQYREVTNSELKLNFSNQIQYKTKTKMLRSIEFISDPTVADEAICAVENDVLKVRVATIGVVSMDTIMSKGVSDRSSRVKPQEIRSDALSLPPNDDTKRGPMDMNFSHMRTPSIPGIASVTMSTIRWGKILPPNPTATAIEKPFASGSVWAQSLFAFTGSDPTEATFEKGQTMRVLQKLEDGWWQVDINGKLLYAPSNYLELIAAPVLPSQRKPSRHGNLPHISTQINK